MDARMPANLREAAEECKQIVEESIQRNIGDTSLQNYYSTRIGDDEFNRNRQQIEPQDGVKIRDKEQLAYYRLYRGMFPPPRETARTKNICPDCGADVRPQATFCITCGAYPIKAFRPRTNLRAKG